MTPLSYIKIGAGVAAFLAGVYLCHIYNESRKVDALQEQINQNLASQKQSFDAGASLENKLQSMNETSRKLDKEVYDATADSTAPRFDAGSVQRIDARIRQFAASR